MYGIVGFRIMCRIQLSCLGRISVIESICMRIGVGELKLLVVIIEACPVKRRWDLEQCSLLAVI